MLDVTPGRSEGVLLAEAALRGGGAAAHPWWMELLQTNGGRSCCTPVVDGAAAHPCVKSYKEGLKIQEELFQQTIDLKINNRRTYYYTVLIVKIYCSFSAATG